MPVSMVWPCLLSVEAYASAGRGVDVPRLECPRCAMPMCLWAGYRRWVRSAGRCWWIFVPRQRCARCVITHAVLPAFVLAGRLDVADSIGWVLETVASGAVGVRRAAVSVSVAHTTAREWQRRFTARAGELGVAFAGLCAELGGPVLAPLADVVAGAVAAIGAAFTAVCEFPGWAGLSRWRFASAVSGGGVLAANTISPFLVVGKRRFLAPVPHIVAGGGDRGP